MSSRVRTAVILAAGLGSRLKDKTKHQPKGFLQVDGKSLIERSIQQLLKKGIEKIVIGTGYLHEHFEGLKKTYPQIVTVRSEHYATTGSLFTLQVVSELLEDSFLLLESDLLYDPIALDHLLEDENQDIILASGTTNSGDEVYIQCSPSSTLVNMSKDKSKLDSIAGELVGITKLSFPALQKMMSFAKAEFSKGNTGIHYEDGLVGISTDYPLAVKVIKDLVWCEIDDEHHLERALTKILPRIKE
jgi:2-aminoethylphosphonate-pyruvate transaminase